MRVFGQTLILCESNEGKIFTSLFLHLLLIAVSDLVLKFVEKSLIDNAWVEGVSSPSHCFVPLPSDYRMLEYECSWVVACRF